MKKTIILPIKKEFCDLIFSGSKHYEFRKSIPRQKIEKILIYESRGCGMIVGEVEVIEIITENIHKLWDITKDKSGIKKTDFDKYFHNKLVGVAYKLGHVKKYGEPIPLKDFGINSAPQNYIYI